MNNKTNKSPKNLQPKVDKVHFWVILLLQIILSVALILEILQKHWQNVFTITCIILIIHAPARLGNRYRVKIPPEFELMAILFAFAALFLGELHGYYTKYWWWDIALHTTSGLLLGIFGFLLVYWLNQDDRIRINMKPRFVAIFAFMFAVAIGAVWEIFEFSMDQLFGLNMQKAMLDDPSGLTDTMWDLIVDTLGAAVISLFGYWHMRMDKESVFDGWINKFVTNNPQLFGRH